MSEHYDPRRPQDSNVAITVGGLIAVIATIAILYISGTIYIPHHTGGDISGPSTDSRPGRG
jgi:hypothetical protein